MRYDPKILRSILKFTKNPKNIHASYKGKQFVRPHTYLSKINLLAVKYF